MLCELPQVYQVEASENYWDGDILCQLPQVYQVAASDSYWVGGNENEYE